MPCIHGSTHLPQDRAVIDARGESPSRSIRCGALVAVFAQALIASACPAASSPPATQPAVPAVASRPASAPLRPRSDEFRDARLRMVARQLAARDIVDERVLQAMRDVPRHWFVPPDVRAAAYEDHPLPIGHEQTISQPYIVALMTQLAAVRAGDRVLEIGAGSGYQAAVLSELTDRVFTIEIVAPLAERTARLLKQRGYDTIRTRTGDGFRGWPEAAPFDAILVTCAPDEIPPPLLEQLAPGGRLVIPVGPQPLGQELLVVTRTKAGALERRSVTPVLFVPMTGEAGTRK